MCQKHTINNITGTGCAEITKKGGCVNKMKILEIMGNLGNKCDK